MPKVRKLTPDEVRKIERRIKGQRKLIEEEYDAIMVSYSAGDYGEAELNNGENRITVRNRLKAAAARLGLTLDFRRTKGNVLRFRVLSPDGQLTDGEGAALASTPEPAKKPRGRKKLSL